MSDLEHRRADFAAAVELDLRLLWLTPACDDGST
jgi:hypothetical protein